MKKIILIAIILAIIVGGGVYYFRDSLRMATKDVNKTEENAIATSGVTKEAIKQIENYQYTETFTHPDFNFSFNYPADFEVSQIPDGAGGETILVSNTETKVGVQMMITPFDEPDLDLTADKIHESLPELAIKEPQEVLIGEGRKGLAFLSDNEQFGGQSREVWFVFGGNLYQISTYAELDGFLKGMFGTWEFR